MLGLGLSVRVRIGVKISSKISDFFLAFWVFLSRSYRHIVRMMMFTNYHMKYNLTHWQNNMRSLRFF